jgi:hypothetical protein
MTLRKQKKNPLDYFVYVAIALSVGVVVAGAVVILFPETFSLGPAGPGGALPRVNFTTLEARIEDDSYLACPDPFCPGAEPDEQTPTYALPVSELRDRVIAFVDQSPGLGTRRIDLPNLQFDFVAYNAGGLSYTRKTIPDVVTVRFYEISPSRSTLAIYSRTLVGKADKAEHRERVQLWLRQLEDAV